MESNTKTKEGNHQKSAAGTEGCADGLPKLIWTIPPVKKVALMS